ncbi:MAG: gliding motility-associated C-terminal domain-containing protein, partial [Bacteroidota bacterium]
EHENKQVLLSSEVAPDLCWHQVTIVRNANEFFLYLNGELADEGFTMSTIQLRGNPTASSPLRLGGSPCPDAPNEFPFEGLVDELRIYNNALSKASIRNGYQAPDRIITDDALIVLGDSLQINTALSCVSRFTWSPATGVSDINTPNAVITPTESGKQVYTLEFNDGTCIAKDQIMVNAVNPEELDCNLIFLPNVFTPNNDGLNDVFSISNPFVVEEIISFEIFDRWGARLFQTTDPMGAWDGTFKGMEVNPGVMLYKVTYKCSDTEFIKTGSVKILR